VRRDRGQYQAAIRDAVREVTGRPIAWYFLHVDLRSPVVLPRVMSLDRERGEACVTMVSAGNDPSWNTQWERPSTLDDLITVDGQAGRLVELFRNRSVIGFHTHWQSLFSEGRWTGLRDLRTTLGRIREHFGDGVAWTKCSDLARIIAAQAVTRVAVDAGGGDAADAPAKVTLASTIACPDFTVRLRTARPVRAVHAGPAPLRRLGDGDGPLEPGTWRAEPGGGIVWCADLRPARWTFRFSERSRQGEHDHATATPRQREETGGRGRRAGGDRRRSLPARLPGERSGTREDTRPFPKLRPPEDGCERRQRRSRPRRLGHLVAAPGDRAPLFRGREGRARERRRRAADRRRRQRGGAGTWRRRVEGVEGGKTYRFTAWWRAENVAFPTRSVSARLDWRGADGERVRPPDYARDAGAPKARGPALNTSPRRPRTPAAS
jgi:hypothetical protein